MPSICQVFAFFVLAVTSVQARECSSSDFAPFSKKFDECADAAEFPATPTTADIYRGCKFPVCVEVYNLLATMNCTINGNKMPDANAVCNISPVMTTPSPATIKECTSTDLSSLSTLSKTCTADSGISEISDSNLAKFCSYPSCTKYINGFSTLSCSIKGTPASEIAGLCSTKSPTTKTPTPTAKECSKSDFNEIRPVMAQCDSDSGIANLTKANLPLWCTYPNCVKATQLYAKLTCTISGSPASDFATVCAKPTPTTRSPTPTNNIIDKECTSADMPSTFSSFQRQCLFVAGLNTLPTSISGLVGLCQYSDCASALKLYSGLTCTLNGLPSSVVATACRDATPAPSTTVPKVGPSSSSVNTLSLFAAALLLLLL